MKKTSFSKKTQKHVFCALSFKFLLQNPLFLWGKNFGSTRHLCEKNEPTLDRFGEGCMVSPAGS